MRLLSLHTCVVVFISCVCFGSLVAQSSNSLKSRGTALNDLLAEQWEYRLRTSPLFASFLGDKRWNDKLDDYSQEAIDKNLQETQKFLTRFEAIDTSGFPEQEVSYFHRYTAMDEPNVQSEVDRYIAWPGQALGYKIGQLKILELRQYAKDQLGDKFDIRAFHDEIIGGGALPLDVLDKRVRDWVAAQKAASTQPSSKSGSGGRP